MSYSATITPAFVRATAGRQRNIVYSNRRVYVFLLILLIILFGVLYLIQANNVATGSYKIQKYQNEIAKLQSENKNFELQLSEVRSLGFLEKRIEGLNMVKISKVEYLSPVSQVAAK